MNWFTSFLSGSASNLVDSVGTAIDKIVTSDEEKLLLKNALQDANNKHERDLAQVEVSLEQELTKRHEADMRSDSWLSKNIRPLVLAFLTITVILMAAFSIFLDLTTAQITTLEVWLPLFITLLTSTYTYYFIGRSVEKKSLDNKELIKLLEKLNKDS